MSTVNEALEVVRLYKKQLAWAQNAEALLQMLEQAEARVAAATAEEARLAVAITSYKAEVETLRGNVAGLQSKMQRYQVRENEAAKKAETLEADLEAARAAKQQKIDQEFADKYRDLDAVFKAQAAAVTAEIDALIARRADAQAACDEVEKKLADLLASLKR